MSAARGTIAEGFTPRERLVVMCLYCEQLTVEETALAIGITAHEVDQIHNDVVSRVRQLLNRRPPK